MSCGSQHREHSTPLPLGEMCQRDDSAARRHLPTAELVGEFHDELVSFASRCLRKLRCEGMIEPEDLVLDVELDVIAGRLQVPPMRAASPVWYKGVIKNRARHVVRDSARLTVLDEIIDRLTDRRAAVDPAARAEVAERVQAALQALGDRRREIIRLHWEQDLTVPEISRRLRIQPATVWTHLYRGAKQLRRQLVEFEQGL